MGSNTLFDKWALDDYQSSTMRKRSLIVLACLALTACSEEGHHHGDHQHGLPDVPTPDVNTPDVADGTDIVEVVVPVLTALVDMVAFVPVEEAGDPWSDKAPAPDDICTGEDLKAETTPDGDWFDIHTEFCSYSTVTAPLLVDISEGDAIQVQVYFSSIVDGDGPYTVGTALGEPAAIFWEESVSVPAEETVLTGSWTATTDLAAGQPAFFHVSNHGENIWSLIRFARVE